jgi:cytidylate kinase
MQIICISRGGSGYSSNLAEKLASKIGYACISREMLTDKATDYGIPVGKLEIEILKKRPLSEKLSLEVDRFKAFVTAQLCERVQQEGIVYHGRLGHLSLPGLSHVLRVRVMADPEKRIAMAMARMNLSLKKAKDYIQQTDEDIRRWIRTIYNEDSKDPSLFDVTINAENLSVESAATSIMQMAQLPEFQPTSASAQTLSDLLLASRCRLALGQDEKTRNAKVAVTANEGHISATYLPRQAQYSKEIARVLASMENAKSFVCTVALTNIMLIGERFDSAAESFNDLVDIATNWNAAVEIVRLASEGEPEVDSTETDSLTSPADTREINGGILDEGDNFIPPADSGHGLTEAMNRLIQVGRAGMSRNAYGGIKGLITDVSKNKEYSMIVVGDIFSSKGGAKQRLKRDAISLLIEKFRIPVMALEDLKSEYLFGKKQFFSLVGFAAVSALMYLVVFSFQKPLLSFVSAGQFSGGLGSKIAAAVAVFISVPIMASIIGGFYHNLLKMIKLE